MFVLGFPVAVAVAALHYEGPVMAEVERARDRAALVATIDDTRLDLWQRSVGLSVQAHASAVGNGCSTTIASELQGQPNGWTRLLRWDQVAWTGTLADGRVMVAFFEQDGRLAGDRVTFAPADPAAFRAGVMRVARSCRDESAEGERVMVGDYPTWRSCYFARQPAIELIEMRPLAGPAEPPRATMSIYARETPEAELQLLFDGDPDRAEVAFTVASRNLRREGVASAVFALDGVAVAPRHSLALYGDTRLRIRMDPARTIIPVASTTEPAYFSRLFASKVATVTLLNAEGAQIGTLTFDIGQTLANTRAALTAVPWTCAASTPAASPAALWHLAP